MYNISMYNGGIKILCNLYLNHIKIYLEHINAILDVHPRFIIPTKIIIINNYYIEIMSLFQIVSKRCRKCNLS
jgi:hypothetical protein